jgi:hypothetical protein
VLLLIFLPVVAFSRIVFIKNNWFKGKERFYIQLTDENFQQQRWEILRRFSENEVLLINKEDECFKFVDNNDNQTLESKHLYREIDEVGGRTSEIQIFVSKHQILLNTITFILVILSLLAGYFWSSFMNLSAIIVFGLF